MPFSLTTRRSKKFLPKIKAPIRKARLSYDDAPVMERKPNIVKKISINLDGIVSTLMSDGNWCVDYELKSECREYLHQTQMNEKLTKENEILKRRHGILMELAKTKTEEIDIMEKELRKLRHIVKQCAPKGCYSEAAKKK